MSVLSIHFSSFQLSKNIIQWAEYIIVTSTLQYSHGLRNEMHFCAEVSSQARSMLRFFAVKGSQIPLHYVNGRAAKNALKPNRCSDKTRCATRGFSPRDGCMTCLPRQGGSFLTS